MDPKSPDPHQIAALAPDRRLGAAIPANNLHGVSVSLPTWKDTVGWATRDPKILEIMRTGYPRFFMHRNIVELGERLVGKFSDQVQPGLAMPFCCKSYAEQCESHLLHHAEQEATVDAGSIYNARFATGRLPADTDGKVCWELAELHVVFYPKCLFQQAKSFWQHTGYGISSRYAVFCLEEFDKLRQQGPNSVEQRVQENTALNSPEQLSPKSGAEMPRNVVQRCLRDKSTNGSIEKQSQRSDGTKKPGADQGSNGKDVLRSRIAEATSASVKTSPDNVYIYPTGMSAITIIARTIHQQASATNPATRPIVVVYGFLYLDTIKTLQIIRGGFDIRLYGHSTASELTQIESLVTQTRIAALFCEFPSNPLMNTPDLHRLRAIADTHQFPIICDDTVGTFVNVDVLPAVDVLVTSLTKIFSGACDVMGGSLVLNPQSPHFRVFNEALRKEWIDAYFPADARVMELNSRDFKQRMGVVNRNAKRLVGLLRNCKEVEKVYYPLGSATQGFYDRFLKREAEAGYGYLVSIIFKSPAIAKAFYDKVDVAKGPSLGTNFTLTCAYTLFAHYNERPWAAGYGVTEDLVRISVGVEEWEELRGKVMEALDFAGRVGGEGV